jgi:photosystem II stability/assembly factor-like uncharacterized protein
LKVRSSKNTRNFHKWVGLVCAAFFVVLSISGVLLMHYDTFGFNNVVVSGNFLPDKYFQLAANKRSIQAITATKSGTLFVGTDYGLYRSNDAGKTWTQLEQGMFNQNIHVIAIDPKDEDILYAGTSGGVFKTEDGGDHWTDWFDAASGLTNGEVNDLVIHPADSEILFAATEGGLFHSDDAGESWELLFDGEGVAKEMSVQLVRLSSVDPRDIYIASEHGMYRSNNDEKRWVPVWASQIANVLSMVSLKTDPEFFYIGTRKGLFKSFNRGRNWVQDKTIKAVPSLLVNPKDITNLTVAAGKKILVSQDGGDTWQPLKTHPAKAALSIARIFQTQSPSPVLLAGTASGLFLSRDGGGHWEEPELSNSVKNASANVREMDLVKLITEIHTGRFFGNYFMLLVDLATLGLIVLVISGIRLVLNRNKIRRQKNMPPVSEDEEELLINVQETAGDLYTESTEIHDMIEHISNHLEKCKTIYMTKEKKEIAEIDRHITTLDKKMHQLMRRIGEFEKYSQS